MHSSAYDLAPLCWIVAPHPRVHTHTHTQPFILLFFCRVLSFCHQPTQKFPSNVPFKTFCKSLNFKSGHNMRTNCQTDGAIVAEWSVEEGRGEREWEAPVLLVMTRNEIVIAEQQGHRVTCCYDDSDRHPAASPHSQSGRQISCLNVYVI